jgi:hypothetical protein
LAALRIGGNVIDRVASVSIGLEHFWFTKGRGDSGKGLTPWEFDEEDVLNIHS